MRRPHRMTEALTLGSLAGIPLLVAPSWVVGTAVITIGYAPLVRTLVPTTSVVGSLLVGLTLAVLLGVSVLAHEFGHCAAALRSGIGVRQVHLSLLGGSTELASEPRTARSEAFVAGAGPLVSVGLATLGVLGWWLIGGSGPLDLVGLLILQLGVANAAVAVANLLPGLPLDGGQLLRALVWGVTGRPALGTAAARGGSVVVAVALAAWAVYGLTRGAWVQAVVAVVLTLVVAEGARDGADAPEPEPVPPAQTRNSGA